MKKLLLILLSVTLLLSCGEENLKYLYKNIENEEDAVEALITLTKAKIEMLENLKVSMQELANLSKEMKKRGEDIEEAQKDVANKIYDEDWDEGDLDDEDNWDEYEDLVKDMEELEEDMLELALDNDEDLSEILSYGKGGVKADAKKFCKMKCEAEALETMEETEENVAKALKLVSDVSELGVELQKKYKDDEDAKKEISAIIAKCDCD